MIVELRELHRKMRYTVASLGSRYIIVGHECESAASQIRRLIDLLEAYKPDRHVTEVELAEKDWE